MQHFIKLLLLLSLFVLVSSHVAAFQVNQSKEKDVEQDIQKLLKMVDSLKLKESNQALTYAEQALKKSQKAHLLEKEIRSYYGIGSVNAILKKHSKAEEAYKIALKKAKKLGNKSLELKAQIGCAQALERRGEYLQSIESLLSANALAIELDHKPQQSRIYSSIARVYFNYNDLDKAIEFLNLSKDILIETNDIQAQSMTYNNLGILYNLNEEKQKAKAAFEEAVKTGIAVGDKMGVASTYLNLGLIALKANQLDSSENYLLDAHKTFSTAKVDNPELYNNLGRLYLKKKEYAKAEKYALQSLAFCEKEKMKKEIMKTKELLANIYFHQSSYKKAYEYQEAYEKLEDELFSSDDSQELEFIKNKYELQQKELEVTRLDQSNQQRNYFIIGLLSLVGAIILFSFMLLRQKDLKSKEEKIVLEQKLLLSQMNPHFIFNALSVIQSFIFKNKPKDAGKYLAKFSRLIRMILENSRKEYVPLEEEIESLKYYLDLQQLRFLDKFDYEIQVDEAIFLDQMAIAPMLTQPFIENAIEHGLQHKTDKGWLTINFKLENELLYFILEDNGVGRNQSAIINRSKTHQSLSTKITEERLAIYQQKRKNPFHLEISDIKTENEAIVGTRVMMQIPFKTQ